MIINISLLKKIFWLLIFTLLNITLWGCSSKKMSSCNLLKEITTELEATATNYWESQNTQEIQQVANKFQEAQQKILTSQIEDQNLLESSKKLADIYDQYNKITINYISAYQKKDGEKMNQSQQKMNQLFQEQNTIIQQINNYCRSN